MNKKIIAAAIAASLVAPAAMAEVTVYGKVRQSVDFVDMGTVDNIQINDKTSRLGFKGSEDLGDGLKAVFAMEFGVAISGKNGNAPGNNASTDGDEFATDGAPFGARNAYVGVAGDFGTVLVGRHDHPLKMSTGSFDLFADTIADNNQGFTEGLTDLRANGTVAYVSPSFSGLTVAAAIVPGENNDADGLTDAYSIAAMYNNGGLALSAAYEEGDKDIDFLGGTADYEQTRLGAGYTMDAFTVNVVWADVDDSEEAWVVSGAYTMGNNVLKAKYFDVDAEAEDEDRDGWALGAEHNFSKRTNAGLYYVSTDADAGDAGNDGDIFSIQLNHSF